MKLTLDHNCIINLTKTDDETGGILKRIVTDPRHQCCIVEIGASEMRELGVRPDRYDIFEQLLVDAGIAHLKRLQPMGIGDVTFWNHCVWSDEADELLVRNIQTILFPQQQWSSSVDGNSKESRKLLNRLCDVHTLWCHIRSGNDVFVTSDTNFMKETKLPRLLELDARRICLPSNV